MAIKKKKMTIDGIETLAEIQTGETWNAGRTIDLNYARNVASEAIDDYLHWLWDNDGAIPMEVYTEAEAGKLDKYLRQVQKQLPKLKKGGRHGTAKTRK